LPPPARGTNLVEGFPKRLKQHPSFQFMLISKVVTQLVDFGKEAFEMAQRACFGCPRRGRFFSIEIELVLLYNTVCLKIP